MPCVTRAVLNDAVASLEMNFSAIVEFHINFTGNDNVVIHGVRGVHAGIHGLENFREPREFGLEFREGGK